MEGTVLPTELRTDVLMENVFYHILSFIILSYFIRHSKSYNEPLSVIYFFIYLLCSHVCMYVCIDV